MATAKTKKSPKRKWLVYALLLLVLLIAGFLLYNYLSVQANKKSFQEARVAIDSIYSSTVSTLGQPDASKHINSCGGQQCTVYTSFIYGVSGYNQANKYYKTIQNEISQNPVFIPTKALSKKIITTEKNYSGAQDLYIHKKLSCTAKYLYNTPQAALLNLRNRSMKPFYVEIGCTGPTEHAYYNHTQI